MTDRFSTLPKGSQVEDKGGQLTPIWLNWFNNIFRYLNLAPVIGTGIVAPTSVPQKVGDMYVDIVNKKIYSATGTTTSGDWTVLN